MRVGAGDRFHPPYFVANAEHRFMLAEQLRSLEVTPWEIMIEPLGRNTAPAAAVAAIRLSEKNPSALMLVLPSDHVVDNNKAFLAAIETAEAAAEVA